MPEAARRRPPVQLPQLAAAVTVAVALWVVARAREPGRIVVPVAFSRDLPNGGTTVEAVLEGPAGALLLCRIRPPTLRAGAGPALNADDVIVPAGVRVRRLVTTRAVDLAAPRE